MITSLIKVFCQQKWFLCLLTGHSINTESFNYVQVFHKEATERKHCGSAVTNVCTY